MYPLSGTIQYYDWGTCDVIPKMLGIPENGKPHAEYWLGAHPSSPSLIYGQPLDKLLKETPQILGQRSVGRFGDKLPYLVKILSAAKALSLQVHPSRQQAEEGFAKENEQGIALDSPLRTYRDDWPKPEMLIALTPFDALCGFRDPLTTYQLFHQLGLPGEIDSVIGPLMLRGGSAGLAEVFLDCLTLDEDRRQLVSQVLAGAVNHSKDEGELGSFARTALLLDEEYPSSPAIVAALLMNRIHLEPGEAIFLRAGLMHAYLSGTGVEIMANSDNVVRGGLTSKHIAIDELIKIVDFTSTPVDITANSSTYCPVFDYPHETEEFQVSMLDAKPGITAQVPHSDLGRILLVISGKITLESASGTNELAKGNSCFLPADSVVSFSGDGQAVLTAPGV